MDRMSVHELLGTPSHFWTRGNFHPSLALLDTFYMVNKVRLVPPWPGLASSCSSFQSGHQLTRGRPDTHSRSLRLGVYKGWTYRCESMLPRHWLSHAMCHHRDWEHWMESFGHGSATELGVAADAQSWAWQTAHRAGRGSRRTELGVAADAQSWAWQQTHRAGHGSRRTHRD